MLILFQSILVYCFSFRLMARLINSCARGPHSGHAIGCVDDGPILGLRLRTEDVCVRGKGGKSYGGHDDVQTVFDQAILVAEFSPFPSRKNSNNQFPPPPASTTPPSSSTQILKRKRCQHYTYSSTNKKRQSNSAVHLLVYAAISPIHKVGEIMHSFL